MAKYLLLFLLRPSYRIISWYQDSRPTQSLQPEGMIREIHLGVIAIGTRSIARRVMAKSDCRDELRQDPSALRHQPSEPSIKAKSHVSKRIM